MNTMLDNTIFSVLIEGDVKMIRLLFDENWRAIVFLAFLTYIALC